jgi:hypothetical protein
MRLWKLSGTILVIAIIVGCALQPSAHAQTPTTNQDFALAISPLPILLDAKPGTTASADLRVNNPTSHDEQLKVVLKTFTVDGPNGTVTLHDTSPADDFVNWISFSRTNFTAPPGLWQTVHMTIKIPSTAAFGYYFAVEFAHANPPAGTGVGTSLQGAVASFVLLNAHVPGETKQLQVTSFSADHRIYEFLPANFTIKLHNSGNIFAGASGNIFIKRGSKQVAILNVNANHGLLIPSSNRIFNVSWDDGFPVHKVVKDNNGQPLKDKDGKPVTKLSWNFGQAAKLRFGHYTAQLALVYNNGTRDVPINGTVSFWVVPWRLIIFAVVIVVGPALLVYLITKRRFKKRLQKERRKISNG